MSLTICNILVSHQSGKTVTISRALNRALQIGAAKTVTFRVGSKTSTVAVQTINRKENILVLPLNLAAALKLPRTGKCMVKTNGDREFQIGPLIGVLTGVTNDRAAPFGNRTGYIREIMQAGAGKAYFIVFSPGQVNWHNEEVTGYVMNNSGKLVRKTVPLPDVVYNRLPSRKAEKLTSMENFKERFVRRRIPLFNWSFFDKWDVYRLLDGEKEAEKYVPESSINPTPGEIRTMLEQHRFVYLKPTAGSLGVGIYRLTYNPTRGYFARFRRNGSNVLLRFNQFDSLMKMLKANNIRLQQYVVQQGIRLIELDGCPIDFRFHMTKNGHNQWVASGIGAKKAGRGSVTTHIRSGGQLMTPEQALSRIYSSAKAEKILNNAIHAAVQLAEAIEKKYPHLLGELGFDLGIDQNEKVWMFEANAKPGRSIFKHPSLKPQGKASILNIFEHCLYLSRFRSRREG